MKSPNSKTGTFAVVVVVALRSVTWTDAAGHVGQAHVVSGAQR